MNIELSKEIKSYDDTIKATLRIEDIGVKILEINQDEWLKILNKITKDTESEQVSIENIANGLLKDDGKIRNII